MYINHVKQIGKLDKKNTFYHNKVKLIPKLKDKELSRKLKINVIKKSRSPDSQSFEKSCPKDHCVRV